MLKTDDGGETWATLISQLAMQICFYCRKAKHFLHPAEPILRNSRARIQYLLRAEKHQPILWIQRFLLPIMQGKETTGANSLAVYKMKKAVVVGGDFSKDTISSNNCVLIDLGKKASFSIPQTPPHGYRSCVIYMDEKTLLTCGTSGIDISRDGGKNWKLVAKDGFHVCQKAKTGTAVFLAGNERIAKLVMP
jgi:hypothetical protein